MTMEATRNDSLTKKEAAADPELERQRARRVVKLQPDADELLAMLGLLDEEPVS